jgi:hypothetical protein
MERVGRALCRDAAGKYPSIVFALRFSRHSTGEFVHGACVAHARYAQAELRREILVRRRRPWLEVGGGTMTAVLEFDGVD